MNDLEMNEKIKILNVFFLLYSGCSSIEDLKTIKIRIFILSESQKDSINFKINKFFEKFIELLTEESNIFFFCYK